MAVTELLVPCMSVFTIAMAEEATLQEHVPSFSETEITEPIVIAQATADDLNAAQLGSGGGEVSDTAGMEAPYSAEIQPLTVPTVEGEFEAQPAGPLVFGDKSDDEVFTLAIDYLQEMSTLSANFIQTAPSGNVSTGRLQLSRPGRLRLNTMPQTRP